MLTEKFQRNLRFLRQSQVSNSKFFPYFSKSRKIINAVFCFVSFSYRFEILHDWFASVVPVGDDGDGFVFVVVEQAGWQRVGVLAVSRCSVCTAPGLGLVFVRPSVAPSTLLQRKTWIRMSFWVHSRQPNRFAILESRIAKICFEP
jgi:hypothetical protein